MQGLALLLGPRLLAYGLAAALWLHLRRGHTTRAQAWFVAVAGLSLVIAASYGPVAGFVWAVYDEWRETQPGGRGYYP